jgi:hypothetical protein
MRFFVGLHQPSDAAKVSSPAFISIHRIRNRRGPFVVGDWIMDSGAFSTIKMHGVYPHPVSEYAAQIKRWAGNGNLLAAVAQDYMCEPVMLERTGMTIAEHQRLTIERYDALLREGCGVYIMPVLQGYAPDDYASHLRQYGERLAPGAWVGVGSVCKRNANPRSIRGVLDAINSVRPDLRLHGFGLKITALRDGYIRERFATADSMAWSFAARISGRNGNDWRDAQQFANAIETTPFQREISYGI